MIPPILHQTWKDAEVPARWRPLRQSWRTHHPDWEHRFWTDEDLRQLVRDHYPWFLEAFDGYARPISRVDAARYLLLHRHGGVYADLDFECLRPLNALLECREVVLGLEPERHLLERRARQRGLPRLVCNAFMAGAPAHPFWEHLFPRLLEQRDQADPLEATGPYFLTEALDAYPEPRRITIASEQEIYPVDKLEVADGALDDPAVRERIARSAFAVHHWSGSWIPDYVASRRRTASGAGSS